ncbi:MAG: cupin domain-containing protein [Candidatus Aenigmarchaeota archaeon]|nr:cupin domain-containing protein [Candidatus Aenigmarchaeota archaeon]
MKIEKVQEDPRGSVYFGEFRNKKFLIFSCKKGSLRGGHYHTTENIHFILCGSLELKLINPKNPEKEEKKIVKSGDVIRVEPGTAHLFIANEDSILLEIKEKEFDTVEYRPYRKLVEEFIEKNK